MWPRLNAEEAGQSIMLVINGLQTGLHQLFDSAAAGSVAHPYMIEGGCTEICCCVDARGPLMDPVHGQLRSAVKTACPAVP